MSFKSIEIHCPKNLIPDDKDIPPNPTDSGMTDEQWKLKHKFPIVKIKSGTTRSIWSDKFEYENLI